MKSEKENIGQNHIASKGKVRKYIREIIETSMLTKENS